METTLPSLTATKNAATLTAKTHTITATASTSALSTPVTMVEKSATEPSNKNSDLISLEKIQPTITKNATDDEKYKETIQSFPEDLNSFSTGFMNQTEKLEDSTEHCPSFKAAEHLQHPFAARHLQHSSAASYLQTLLPTYSRLLRLKRPLSLKNISSLKPRRGLKDFYPLARWHPVSRRRRLDFDVQQLHETFKDYERQNKIKAVVQFFDD